MSQVPPRPEETTQRPQRRATDPLWFVVLIASIATGIGMTIFAPVGDDPPPPGAPVAPATIPATTQATIPPVATHSP